MVDAVRPYRANQYSPYSRCLHFCLVAETTLYLRIIVEELCEVNISLYAASLPKWMTLTIKWV